MSTEFDYDPSTDSLYIKLKPGLSVENRIVGDDGESVGYDIQHASQHADAISEALGYLNQHRLTRGAEPAPPPHP